MSDIQQLLVYPLRLTLTAREPLALDEHPGSSLRGALFGALLRRFCVNPTAPTCSECPLHQSCPVAGLVAPLRDERPRGRDVPRPFVLEPPLTSRSGAHIIEPGQSFAMGLTLIGAAIRFFPYVALAARVMEDHGMGRPLAVNAGRRGRFQVERIELAGSFAPEGDETGETQTLYTRDSTTVVAPTRPITPAHVAERAASLPASQLTLSFLSPTRIIEKGGLTHAPQLPTLIARLAERLDALTDEYGQPLDSLPGQSDARPSASASPECAAPSAPIAPGDEPRQHRRERAQSLIEEAARLRLVKDETRWVDVVSHSARQGRASPIGGFVGACAWEGDLSLPLRELLVWGELLHAGKNAVKGDGRYRIDGELSPPQTPTRPSPGY